MKSFKVKAANKTHNVRKQSKRLNFVTVVKMLNAFEDVKKRLNTMLEIIKQTQMPIMKSNAVII